MKTISLDSSNNITLSNYNLSFKNDNDAVAQRVRGRLEFWLGEYFLDINIGTPYLQKVFGINRYQTISSAIKSEILKDSEVVKITEFSISDPNESRDVVIDFRFTTIYNDEISDNISVTL